MNGFPTTNRNLKANEAAYKSRAQLAPTRRGGGTVNNRTTVRANLGGDGGNGMWLQR